MPFLGKVCTRGVWDESIPNIVFDEEGVSNYAHLFEKLVEAYPRGPKGLAEWNIIVEKIKKSGRNKRYNCIVGVSGGTDSCYLLHLAKENGLSPLAVNLDNSWNSDISVKNIKRLTTALSIDLETYVINYEEVKDLLKAYMHSGLPWIDMPSDLAIKSILYKIAFREGVKYILRGNDFRSEGTQPIEWTYGDGRQLNYIHRKFGKVTLKTYPNYTASNLIFYGAINKIKSIYPFYYLDYNKNKAQEFLKEIYSWEYYGGHHHENLFTKFVMSYWLYAKYGIDKRKITMSAQILSGEITRDFALGEIAKLPYDENTIEDLLKFVIKKLDLTQKGFDLIFNSPNHFYKDYPSYYLLFNKFSKIINPFLNIFFIHKPQSFYRDETI